MKEQSHKDEMSAALRGDFQRLRERGVAVTLAPSQREAAPPPILDEPLQAASEAADLTETVSETDSCQDALSDTPEADAVDTGDESRGWLDRLLGR